MQQRGKKWWIIGSSIAVAVLLTAATIFTIYFADRATLGTKIGDQSIAGFTHQQVVDALKRDAEATQVTLKVSDKTRTVGLQDLGIDLDLDKTADKAIHQNNSVIGRFQGIWRTNQVEPTYLEDSETLAKLTTSLVEDSGAPAANAAVHFSEDGGSFEVTPAEDGSSISREQMEDIARRAVTQLQPFEQRLTLEQVSPAISTEKAQKAADEANEILGLKVSITDGIETYEPSSQEKAQWIAIPATEEMLGDPTVDATKVNQWVKDLGEKTNEEPGKGVRNLNSRGDVVSVSQNTANGWKVNNTDEVAQKLLQALKNKQDFVGDFDYDKIEPSGWEENVIPDGTNLVYNAKGGEKWIDVDLSNYTVSAYEGNTIVRGPISMVPGAPQTPTVTGTYKTYLKLPSQTMRGYNVDGSTYETPDVPWPMYFFEDYALHGAYWRSSFGYGGEAGSHGCVNMPVDEAGWFYDWAPIGTTVVSHY